MNTTYNLFNLITMTFNSHLFSLFSSVNSIHFSSVNSINLISIILSNIYIENTTLEEMIIHFSIIPIKVYANSDLFKKDIIEDNKNQAGVYQFINLLTNECYIGSSINLSKRLQQYFQYSYISSPDRGNSKIYSSILKYGYSNFSLNILEYCDKTDAISREQFYIDTIKPQLNILPTAGNSLGYKIVSPF